MAISEINERWLHVLTSPASPGLAGLANLSDEEYGLILDDICGNARRSVDNMLWRMGLFPAAAVVALSRASMKAYGDNFWANFCREIALDIPVGRREELTDSFCRAAARCIPTFERANWEAWSNIGEFLAQAGLPFHHCERFALLLRAAADESGLPEPADSEGISDTVARMLDRPELHGQKVIEKALRGPAGPLLVEAAAAAILDGDYDRFNPHLAKALQQAFESCPRQIAGVALRRPLLKLDRDFSKLQIHCPFPSQQLRGSHGIVWTINGERIRAPHGEPVVFDAPKPALYTAEVSGLRSGKPVRWTVDARPSSWPKGFAAFDAETGSNVKIEVGRDALLVPPGSFYLLHECRFACDEVEVDTEWSDKGISLTLITMRPGTSLLFYDGDEEVRIQAGKSIWFEPSGSAFVTSIDSTKVYYDWEAWPRLWISDDAPPQDWTVEISTSRMSTTGDLAALKDAAGGLQSYAIRNGNSFESLQPGLHRVVIAARHGERVKHKQEWLVWKGLLRSDDDGFTWAEKPMNLTLDRCQGFNRRSDGLQIDRLDQMGRQLEFEVDSERVLLRWRAEGVAVESYTAIAGVKSAMQSHRLGETFPADEFTNTHLRISVQPAAFAALYVEGAIFKKVSSPNGFITLDLSLASLAALYLEGGSVSLAIDDEPAQPIAQFAQPLVAMRAALSSENDFRKLRCLLRQPVFAARVRIKDLISGREGTSAETCIPIPGEAFFKVGELPRIRCQNTGALTLHGCSGFGFSVSASEIQWPVGAWWIEIELQSRPNGSWEVLRDVKGGRLPLLVVQNPQEWNFDYRAHALWWGLVERGVGGVVPSQLPPADGNEASLIALLCEVGAILRERLSEHVWKKQITPLVILRKELAKQANWLVDSGNTEVTDGLISQLNSEESTATPRSIIFSASTLLAVPPEQACKLEEGDALRTSLLWCGRVCTGNSVAEAFHRCELDPRVALGDSCSYQSTILSFFSNGNRLRSNGTLPSGEEFRGFDYWRYFNHLSTGKTASGAFASSLPPLSRRHFAFAVHRFKSRRQAAEECSSLANVNTVFSKSNLISAEIRSRAKCSDLMPHSIWMHPWPELPLENDNLIEMSVQFASVYALAARLGSDRKLSFREFNNWLRSQHWLGESQPQAASQAITTLICQAPELLGFFLMFWQLMIKTHSND